MSDSGMRSEIAQLTMLSVSIGRPLYQRSSNTQNPRLYDSSFLRYGYPDRLSERSGSIPETGDENEAFSWFFRVIEKKTRKRLRQVLRHKKISLILRPIATNSPRKMLANEVALT